jgi:energy-coupling factor transporter ATP-binding protein EcfA2
MVPPPILIPVRPGICYGSVGPILLMYYTESPSVEDLRVRLPHLERLKREHRRGAFLSVIDADRAGVLPDEASRAETRRHIDQYLEFVQVGAVVIRGSSVRATLLRSFLRSLLLIRRSPFEQRFCETVSQAARFCVSALELDPAEGYEAAVLAHLERLRTHAGHDPAPS